MISLIVKLQLSIQVVLLVSLLAAQVWLMKSFEQSKLLAAQERLISISDGAINGLNALMVTV